ncbi:MAG: J domain-containing protein [Deltaproteobacteria bacterium]|nr:J domain-containing protein [Deltaproteobacteria bacterium]
MKDYYAILGVARTATDDEIKRAYRARMTEAHPDHNAGSPESNERAKDVGEAYEELKDPAGRAAYDLRWWQHLMAERARAVPRTTPIPHAVPARPRPTPPAVAHGAPPRRSSGSSFWPALGIGALIGVVVGLVAGGK